MEFVRSNIGKILDLLSLADLSVSDYHETPLRNVTDHVTLDALRPLDAFLEGEMSVAKKKAPGQIAP